MPHLFRFLLPLALVLYSLAAQPYKPGPQVVTFSSDIDDTDQPYGLYVPKGYDPARKYPLVISLHGAGSNHRLNLRRVFGKSNLLGETDAEATRYFPPLPDVDFIVASPLARGTLGYTGIAEKDVYDVLADVRRRFSVDPDRIYLTGLSMGGGGALWMGFTRPDIWAAVAAVCPDAPDETAEFAPNALNLPFSLFHGDIDPVVNVSLSRQWKQRLEDLGAKVEYTEYHNVRHNSWENAYKGGAIFEWFSRFKRNAHPDRVRFVTDRYKYRESYWLEIDELTPGVEAGIDARFTSPTTLDITTDSLGAFSLRLPKAPARIAINGTRIPLRRGPLSFMKVNGTWKQGRFTPAPGEKQPGLEGPISDALARRQIYVYGTGGSPAEDELNARREIAERAAEWGSQRSPLLLTFRVLADKDVRQSDLDSSTVILFGTRETNTVIAALAGKLPIELNAGAADYGLIYVYPNGANYVVINSGLPWFTGIERMVRNLTPRYLPPAFVLTSAMKDFVLFRGSMENVISNAWFDRKWKLPPAEARKMSATGAVKLNHDL